MSDGGLDDHKGVRGPLDSRIEPCSTPLSLPLSGIVGAVVKDGPQYDSARADSVSSVGFLGLRFLVMNRNARPRENNDIEKPSSAIIKF